MSHDVSSNDGAFLTFCQAHDIRYETVHVIAFDVFDTLLYRTVSPRQVYTLWAQALIKEFSLKKTPSQVLKARFTASRIAKLRHVLVGKDREAKYDDMAGILRVLLKIPGSKQSFLDICLRLELEVERSVTYVPEERRALLQAALDTGKQIVCISDFYLPEETLRTLLMHHGICPARLFVSETYALQKATGKLYRKAAQLLQYEAGSILMIGDNRNSDFKAACNSGLQAIWLDSDAQHQQFDRYTQPQVALRQYIAGDIADGQAKPFAAISLMMVLFMRRLHGRLLRDGCEHVLFMSREGEFFKDLFDAYQNQFIAPEHQIKTYYFYVSRKATLLPSIHTVQKESFQEIFKNYPSMSVGKFLKNLGLDQDQLLLTKLREQMNLTQEIAHFSDSLEFDNLLHSELFCHRLLERAAEQRAYFIQYLDSMNLDYRNKGLFVVDIGYSGTSQNNIYRIFQGQIPIYGYYLIATATEQTDAVRSRKTGMLYDVSWARRKDSFAYNPVMLEAVFMASHGAVSEYTMEAGHVQPVCSYNELEQNCYQRTVRPIQDSIRQEFLHVMKWVVDGRLEESDYYRLFEKRYKQFIFHPSETEIRQYMQMVVIDNFSLFSEKYEKTGDHSIGRKFSIRSVALLCKTRGWCLNQQGTNWMAVAFYKMNLWCFNPLLMLVSTMVIKAYDFYTRKAVKIRHRKNKKN